MSIVVSDALDASLGLRAVNKNANIPMAGFI
jgi:hypothetical protein